MESVPSGQAPREATPPASQQASMGADPNAASPEEQQQYDQIVSNAMTLIYSREATPAILAMLQGDGDPVEGLARAASTIMMRVIQSGAQAGVPLSGDVVMHAGTEVFEDLAELSKEAGIEDFSQDQEAFEKAYFLALDYARKGLQDAGMLDPATADADLQKLQRMDADGQLEPMMMGLAGQDAGGPQQQRGLMPAEA